MSLLGINLGRHENGKKYTTTMYPKRASNCKIRWSQRQLSLFGKISVTKSYATSKLIHTITATVVKEKAKSQYIKPLTSLYGLIEPQTSDTPYSVTIWQKEVLMQN